MDTSCVQFCRLAGTCLQSKPNTLIRHVYYILISHKYRSSLVTHWWHPDCNMVYISWNAFSDHFKLFPVIGGVGMGMNIHFLLKFELGYCCNIFGGWFWSFSKHLTNGWLWKVTVFLGTNDIGIKWRIPGPQSLNQKPVHKTHCLQKWPV